MLWLFCASVEISALARTLKRCLLEYSFEFLKWFGRVEEVRLPPKKSGSLRQTRHAAHTCLPWAGWAAPQL